MKLLLVPLAFCLIVGCNNERQMGQNKTRKDLEEIVVKHTIEIVKLNDYVYNPGIAIRTMVKNQTGRDIFFYRPQTQAWYNYNGRKVLHSDEAPMDWSLGVIPQDYNPWNDTINNPAFDLANEMIKKKPELRDHNDLQRFIFSASVFFLKDGEEKEIIEGITSIQHTLPVNCKIVTSSMRTVKDGNKILEAPPSTYRGYEFWTEPIYSDTVFLTIR
jgi:hypothetical protein